jgi:hypothetical protein
MRKILNKIKYWWVILTWKQPRNRHYMPHITVEDIMAKSGRSRREVEKFLGKELTIAEIDEDNMQYFDDIASS